MVGEILKSILHGTRDANLKSGDAKHPLETPYVSQW